jgi:hypothetical protein
MFEIDDETLGIRPSKTEDFTIKHQTNIFSIALHSQGAKVELPI